MISKATILNIELFIDKADIQKKGERDRERERSYPLLILLMVLSGAEVGSQGYIAQLLCVWQKPNKYYFQGLHKTEAGVRS